MCVGACVCVCVWRGWVRDSKTGPTKGSAALVVSPTLGFMVQSSHNVQVFLMIGKRGRAGLIVDDFSLLPRSFIVNI